MSTPKTLVVYGRVFDLMAVFQNTPQGCRDANAYIERTDGASVLANTDAVYIALKDDMGQPVAKPEA